MLPQSLVSFMWWHVVLLGLLYLTQISLSISSMLLWLLGVSPPLCSSHKFFHDQVRRSFVLQNFMPPILPFVQFKTLLIIGHWAKWHALQPLSYLPCWEWIFCYHNILLSSDLLTLWFSNTQYFLCFPCQNYYHLKYISLFNILNKIHK